jgi:hypothetical protein
VTVDSRAHSAMVQVEQTAVVVTVGQAVPNVVVVVMP